MVRFATVRFSQSVLKREKENPLGVRRGRGRGGISSHVFKATI